MPRSMTITEKILADAAGVTEVVPGSIINVKIGLAYTMDTLAKLVFDNLRKLGVDKVFDKNRGRRRPRPPGASAHRQMGGYAQYPSQGSRRIRRTPLRYRRKRHDAPDRSAGRPSGARNYRRRDGFPRLDWRRSRSGNHGGGDHRRGRRHGDR